jgi:hypothetical protein
MSDWFNPNHGESYLTELKLSSNKFLKLYEIAERGIYTTACLRVVYQYFYESSEICDLNFCCIDKVLELNNQNFRVELLKIIVVHWKHDSNYEIYKNRILEVVDVSERDFFHLAFLLHENLVNKFEHSLDNYLTHQKQLFGDFLKHSIVPNLRLLLVIMKKKKMNRTIDFTCMRCPYLDYNSTILTTFGENQEFQKYVVGDAADDFEEMVNEKFF